MESNWFRVRVEKDGRICIPKSLRAYFNIKPGEQIEIKIRKVR